MKNLICLILCAPVVALVAGCSMLQGGKVDTSELISVVNKAALCAEAVNATANDPACRVALAPCRAVYDSGKDVIDANK